MLKIDRSFVAGLGRGRPADAPSSRAIIGLAHALGSPVVAEGVETARAGRPGLRQLGCDYGQGYLFARPGPAESV